ncbi:ABC transporter ATP-binding protein [Lachnoanaerobaculum umeaense]|uniref:ABC transporter ATP-binding protein n=1 Tax=Lachnoanaerobaculum umeaense TaxID=617123 RepID=A0A385PZJ7_9FIRM|nr:ABC transporter ATP-binding protein [Lachnoanaerobaculum umeaense]AYA99422.1 ABC transporter ATP-binding protein [Lachnoanaerobaculum umeaense]PZW99523.1 ABC-2 type transport system ATP-binding protein [Lachnoanaerobaculum umeaense]
MLEIKNIVKSYGRHKALSNLCLKIPAGALYGLVGPNGAGKTTAMKIISGIIYPDSGNIFFNNINIFEDRKALKEIVGYVPDVLGIYDDMTVFEYMIFFAAAYGFTGYVARKKSEILLEQVGMTEKKDFYLNELSRGMQQKLCVARALIHDPELIIMDEPASGLDPRARYELKELLQELNAGGKTVILSSHILSEVSEICTDIGIIDGGKMVISGSVEDILEKVEGANPIKVKVLNNESLALEILKNNENVRILSVDNGYFMVYFEGKKIDEAKLLEELVKNNVLVSEFIREPGSLESFFIKVTNHSNESVIFSNEY